MHPVEWIQSSDFVPYPLALEEMQQRVVLIQENRASELVWLLQHPSTYTAGTSAKTEDLLHPNQFPVYQAGRGGQFTYHGPGQRVGYVMLDLGKREKDIRAYIKALEQWIIDTLAFLKICGERREGRVGIWVRTPQGEEKIAAIGVRLSKWVSFHGIAINVNPDLSHFSGIIPCGLPQFGVTSLHRLGIHVSLPELDELLQKAWNLNNFLKINSDP